MSSTATVLGPLLDPITDCLTPNVAGQITGVRADPTTQAMLDELASKASEGELTAEDQTNYAAYVDAIDLIAILQSKARAVLANARNA